MASNVTYAGPEVMPETIPVFPLSGALLLPRGQMPLNIFEPRYMSMIDHAMKTDRLIGMIQPNPDRGDVGPLFQVGCAGRITELAETGDGRYILTLTGIARFRIRDSVGDGAPFLQFLVDWMPFADDYTARFGEDAVDRLSVMRALKDFSEANNLPVDWDSVKDAPNEALVNALSMMCPYGVREKQALLEAADLRARGDMLVAITEMELAKAAGGGDTPLQ
ncbi:MAG: LON peptidase substrate-binding domain-containing protein [Methylocystis sp.]|jgi:Lon protease-like protein|nr:LON peptidase substrate-binding domain-containing protein [Methylocystis sp.]MCA3583763.1 LON peptidase substrate-binding domain-containing protein [Methylocystis sp.]MCA3586436.1 LON peptidase substrate-binding domain-containing protein [Methylocystis sp.]MCA3589963.1 LON peptidase substrate-binding domain-containing protein [Methylocystis sp.]